MATTTRTHEDVRAADGVSNTDVARSSTGWIWGLIFIAAIVLGLFLAFGTNMQDGTIDNPPAANPNVDQPADSDQPPAPVTPGS